MEQKLIQLKVNKATGPDELPAWVLDFATCPAGLCNFQQFYQGRFSPKSAENSRRRTHPQGIPTSLHSVGPASNIPDPSDQQGARTLCVNGSEKWWMTASTHTSLVPSNIQFYYSCRGGNDALCPFWAGKAKPHVRALLLDYSKPFHMVNHHSLLRKLGEVGPPLCLFEYRGVVREHHALSAENDIPYFIAQQTPSCQIRICFGVCFGTV